MITITAILIHLITFSVLELTAASDCKSQIAELVIGPQELREAITAVEAYSSAGIKNDRRATWEDPDVITQLRAQRDAFRERNRVLEMRWPGTARLVRTLDIGAMIQANVLVMGPSSSGKSTVTGKVYDHSFADSHGNTHQTFVRVDMNPSTGDYQLFGYMGLDDSPRFTEAMLAPVILFDELDKAGPGAFSSLFSLLAERQIPLGGRSYKVPLASAIATANTLAPEFIGKIMTEAGLATAAGLAFLNRFNLQTVTWDFPADLASLVARLRLSGGIETSAHLNNGKIPAVNTFWLGNLIFGKDRKPENFSIKPTSSAVNTLADFFINYRQALNGEKGKMDPNSSLPFVPPSLVNNKTVFDLAFPVIAASLFLDLLSLDESSVPIEDLAKFMGSPTGMLYEADSLYRLYQLFTTTTPGTVTPTGDHGIIFTNVFDGQLDPNASDPTSIGLRQIQIIQRTFATILKTEIAKSAGQARQVADQSAVLLDLLKKLLGQTPATANPTPEEVVLAAQRAASSAP